MAGRCWPGYVLSVAAVLLWRRYSEPAADFEAGPAVVIENLVVHLIYYPAIVEVVVFLRNTERRLERMVDARTVELRAEIDQRQQAQVALRKLGAELSDAEDGERRRIAYDIHDALSQMLGVVKLNLETAVAESPLDSRQHERLADLVQIVGDLIRQTRDLTFDLHPSMLDDLGLVPTLKGFANDFHRRTMADVTINEVGERKNIPSSLASYLFRATKELMNNAVKHGNAKEIVVAVHWIDGCMRVVVDDDGSGFDPAAPTRVNGHRGLGLAGIDERLNSLGGKLLLESQPGQGTRVVLETPLSAQYS